MQNSKLYSILNFFDKYEQNRLRKFLTSPYFNRSEVIVRLFDFLTAHHNGKSSEEITKEKLWISLYGNDPYDDVLFRKNCSDLLKLIEKYLAIQIYEENPLHEANYLIESVVKKKIERLFSTTIRTANRLKEQQLYRTSNYYLAQYQVEKNFYDLMELRHDRTAKRNVEAILNNLDIFYFSEKLKYSCFVLSQQSLVSHEYKLLLMDEIINYIRNNNFDDVPPVAVYYQVYLTYVDSEDFNHYFRLMELLNKYGDFFPKNEAEFIYQAALNYCIKKINQGDKQFLEEYFIVFEILLRKELLLTEGELSPWHFRNIVVVALRLGKYDWAEKFISEYQAFLPEAMRDNAVSFNLAQLYFSQKKFDKVIELLRNVEYEDLTYNLNSKTMLMSTYYEMDEIEPLIFLLDSFRTYLNRHKDIPYSRKVQYLNLIRFTKQLIRIFPGDKKALEKLNADIQKAEPKGIANLSWLREKIADLE